MIIDAERIGSGHAPAGVRVDFQDRRGEAAPLPVDADPRAIAERLIDSPREAMRVGTADLATLGAAFLALDDEITLLRAEIAALRTPLFKMDLSNGQITKIEDPRREPLGAAVG